MGENVHEYEALCDSDGLSEDNSGKNKSWNFLAVEYRIILFYMKQFMQATVFRRHNATIHFAKKEIFE
jgi:hypothetical protein